MGSSKRAPLAERMKVFGLLCLVGVAAAGSISRAPSRDEKLFSVFNIIKFNNDVCTASDGNMGTCYTDSECSALGGTATGKCAASFGVCCRAIVDSCSTSGTLTKMNNTYIQNAGYPNTIATGQSSCATSRSTSVTYTYLLMKTNAAQEQIRLDFVDVEIDAPASGSCANSTITVTGADAVTTKILPTNLCGVLTGSHVYLSIKDVALNGNLTLTIKLNAAGTQKWNILVRYYESSQTAYLAPRGCLQFYRNASDTISTFNYNNGAGELLTDHMYSICIDQYDAMCDVQMTSSGFMLGGTSGSCAATDDKLVLGTNTFCGSTFGTSGSFTWPYSGSYKISVMSATTNAAMNDGFKITYMLLPC